MKHSFKLRKSLLKNIYTERLGFSNITLENKKDVENTINTILNFIGLETSLIPVNCSYNFINSTAYFQLELINGVNKLEFFESIKKFEEYVEVIDAQAV
ncbi:hypothetical protein [Corallibacter sp.]|uniref:hypothetical protein n=1 Tax=Corallibacter sp. TaxID=2038084 RepID=UPI003A91539A